MSLLLTVTLFTPFIPELAVDPSIETLLERTDAQGAAAHLEVQAPQDSPDELFREATDDLVVVVGEGGASWKMMDLVQEYGRLTDQNIQITEQTRGMLETTATGLTRSVIVPKAEVQVFFERVLAENAFVLNYRRDSEARLLGITWRYGSDRENLRTKAYAVPQDQLAAWSDHPAVLITTSLHLPNTDARMLTNSMRSALVDQNTQQMLPAGEHSIVLMGFADKIVALAEMLRVIDDAAAEEEEEEASLPQVRRFALENAVAGEIAHLIEDLIRAGHLTPEVPSREASLARPRVIADHRTNALIVMCLPADMQQVEEIVRLFDVKQD